MNQEATGYLGMQLRAGNSVRGHGFFADLGFTAPVLLRLIRRRLGSKQTAHPHLLNALASTSQAQR